MTEKLVEIGGSLDLPVVNHIILSPEAYFFFADEGSLRLPFIYFNPKFLIFLKDCLALTTDQYSLEFLALDIIYLIEDLKLNRIHYVGNSAGGVLGYIVISKISDHFLSLTTFGTTSQMNLPLFLAPLVKGIGTFMLRFFTNWYLRFVASHAGLNEESREISYQMFLKASQAILGIIW